MRYRLIQIICLLFSILCTESTFGHARGEHYIWLDIETNGLSGNIEFSVRDLNEKLGYEVDPEAELDNQDIQPFAQSLEDYVLERVAFGNDEGLFPLTILDMQVSDLGEGNFLKVFFEAGDGNPVGRLVTVRDELLFEFDRQHRGILLIAADRRQDTEYREREVLVFSPFNTEQQLDLDDPPRLMNRLDSIWQGMLHIFMGLDHVLFLITLLFTAVLIRTDNQWQPVDSFGEALWNVVKIVTVFTVAHSITLFLAGMGYLNLSSRLVESIIALSIIVVAANNLLGRFNAKKIWIILAFGLFHGMGFATVMAELPFRMVKLLSVVLFFNVGVELGQIVIVALVFPVLFLARRLALYQPLVVTGGSLAVAAIATWWLVQRAF